MRNRITAALSAMVFVLLFLCACGRAQSVSLSLSEGTVAPTGSGAALCASADSISKLTKLADSSRVAMYFDKNTYSVCVHDLDSNKVWRSLPQSYNKNAARTPEVLGVSVIAGGKTYDLNSQLHSVANGLASYEKTQSGVRVSYTFSFDADSKKAAFTVPVEYTLTDGSLFVTVSCGGITYEGEAEVIIREIRLLNFFGSTLRGAAGDYMLVPDGCGATIRTDRTAKDFEPVQLKVYGADPACSGEGDPAHVGAYGFKQGESAVAVIIEDGDALATVYADTVANCGYNYAGAGFEITSARQADGGKLELSKESYSGEIRLCYRFLSNNNANYAAMAAACREQLIRGDTLSPLSLNEGDALPVVVSVIGAANTGKGSLTRLTTFEQTQDLLTLLKAKGLSNIYLRYKGMLKGGMNQTDISGISLNRQLGDADSFNELTKYMSAQHLELFMDIDLLSAAKGSYPRGYTAKDISGSAAHIEAKAPLLADTVNTRSLLNLEKLEDTVLDVLTRTRDTDISGFCLNDAGSLLYSDFSGGYSCRRQAKEHIASRCLPLVTGRKLMVDTGNIYILKNVCAVNDIPMTATGKQSEQYSAIPFLQMIIHGTMYYSPSPLNLEKDSETAFLRCIEYGAIPCFEWCYSTESTPENYLYSAWATQAYEMYEKANDTLRDISGRRITNHYAVTSTVSCTVYAGNTMIYVNYGNKPYEINGTPVEAHSFLRIN